MAHITTLWSIGGQNYIGFVSCLLLTIVRTVLRMFSLSVIRVLGEFSVVLLHILNAMHEQMLQHAPSSVLTVSLLSLAGLEAHMRRHVQQGARAAANSESAAGMAADTATTLSARHSMSTRHMAQDRPLLFSAAASSSPLRIRWCTSWTEATCDVPPVRAFYMPSLTWLHTLGTDEQRQQLVAEMLHGDGRGVVLYPPVTWDALLESKPDVYKRFHALMLPTRWVSLASVNNSLSRLARELLKDQRDGDYYVKVSTAAVQRLCKASISALPQQLAHVAVHVLLHVQGGFSFAGHCASRIRVQDGRCHKLAADLRRFVSEQHQLCVGIQPFIAGFEQFELRTWLVLDHATQRWRPSLTIKTSHSASEGMTAELYQPLHGSALRIADLVEHMLVDHADFFERARLLGIPALRVDCGYDEATHRAFFSEFACAGDASMWSEVHGQVKLHAVRML